MLIQVRRRRSLDELHWIYEWRVKTGFFWSFWKDVTCYQVGKNSYSSCLYRPHCSNAGDNSLSLEEVKDRLIHHYAWQSQQWDVL